MNHPGGDPAKWNWIERREFICNALNWYIAKKGHGLVKNIYYCFEGDSENCTYNCQELRRKLVKMGYYVSMVLSEIRAHVKVEEAVDLKVNYYSDDSENRAVVIAACRALLAREEEK